MNWWASLITEHLWRNAVTAIPLALVVAAFCRWVPARPATRHTLWLVVLLWFVGAPLLPAWRVANLPEAEATVAALAGDQPGDVTDERADQAAPVNERPLIERAMSAEMSAANGMDRSVRPAIVGERPSRAAVVRERSSSKASRKIATADHPTPARVTYIGDEKPAPAPAIRNADDPVVVKRLDDSPPLVAPAPARKRVPDHSPTTPRALAGQPLDIATDEAADESAVSEVVSPAQPRTVLHEPSRWRQWLVGVAAIRDAVARVPSLPWSIWAGGLGAIVLAVGLRLTIERWGIRDAVPAPPLVQHLVAHASAAVGLRRVPATFMVMHRSSPMIWCGLRTRLILPAPLWEQLDETGRRAVILHELAHLVRRDHWVCWLELLVCGIYWWHPLVWWVRHRVHEEADLCCDAWVTWLMPRGRRAYAEALLATKRFLRGGPLLAPAIGIGVLSPRGKRLARRITMVMTQTKAPGHTLTGVTLAVSLVLAGWFVTPARSHPTAVLPFLPSGEVDANGKLVMPSLAVPHATDRHESTGATGRADDNGWLDRLDRLEHRLEQIRDQVRAVSEAAAATSAKRSARWQRTPLLIMTPPASYAPSEETIQDEIALRSQKKEMLRRYELPEGKLEALTALMSRSDVPLLINPGKGFIEVNGTPAQHDAFAAFVKLIHPSADSVAEKPGVAIGGVPSLFGEMFAPLGLARPDDDPVAKLKNRFTELEAQLFEADTQSAQFEQRSVALQAQVRALQYRAAILADQGQDLTEQADHLIATALKREKEADNLEGDKQTKAMSEARELGASARAMKDKAGAIVRRAGEFREKAQEFDRLAEYDMTQAQGLARQSEALAEQIRAIQEQLDAER